MDSARILPLDPHTLFTKALLVEHIVSLVQDKHLELRHVQLPASDDILDSARCSYNNRSPDGLVTSQSAGNGWGDLEILNEATDGSDNTFNLASQLSTWGQSKGLWLIGLTEVDSRQYRGDESSSLARARLGLCKHVPRWIAKHQRKGLALDLGGFEEV